MIKYQLQIEGFLDELDRTVVFMFCIPYVYDTYEEAESFQGKFYTKPRKTDTGEIVFDIYEKSIHKDIVIDTIHWSEYWKYECQILKETISVKKLSDVFPEAKEQLRSFEDFPCLTDTDFEPYADRFEEMYKKYLKKRKFEEICDYAIQSTAYAVQPIIDSNINKEETL